MPRSILPLLLTLLVAGCTQRDPVTVLTDVAYRHPPASAPRPPNLVLGPSVDHARLSEAFTFRSDWPNVPLGVRLGELTTYTDVTYDDQSYYDRFGGGFFQIRDSVRTGVMIR